jgi:hypothetical protein
MLEVHFVPGNHVTMLDMKETAAVINRQVMTTEALQSDQYFLSK